MSVNAYWSTPFSDGIITGRILFKKGTCDHCGKNTRLIEVQEMSLPNGMEPTDKFIFYMNGTDQILPVGYIGITCGCYGKGMRQIAYVIGIRKGKGK